MGRVRTAAAKKYIENAGSSDDEVNVSDLKRTSRSKRASTSHKDQASPIASTSRVSRSKRRISAADDMENGENGVSLNSSSSSSENEAPVANRKQKTSNSTTSPKKQKLSTSETESKNKPKQNESKQTDATKNKKKKKKEENVYEVEEILDHKIENNTKYFLVRWKGYDESADSWQSQNMISCPALLAKYYDANPEARVSAKRSKKKKPVIPKPRQLKIDEQIDYDSNWDENEDYEVEKILDVYIHRNNKREFLIRWKGYSSNSDSWEPEENLDCKDLIEKFMGKVEKMKNLSQKDLRAVRSQTQRFTLMTQANARRLSKRNVDRQRTVYYDCDE